MDLISGSPISNPLEVLELFFYRKWPIQPKITSKPVEISDDFRADIFLKETNQEPSELPLIFFPTRTRVIVFNEKAGVMVERTSEVT